MLKKNVAVFYLYKGKNEMIISRHKTGFLLAQLVKRFCPWRVFTTFSLILWTLDVCSRTMTPNTPLNFVRKIRGEKKGKDNALAVLESTHWEVFNVERIPCICPAVKTATGGYFNKNQTYFANKGTQTVNVNLLLRILKCLEFFFFW